MACDNEGDFRPVKQAGITAKRSRRSEVTVSADLKSH